MRQTTPHYIVQYSEYIFNIAEPSSDHLIDYEIDVASMVGFHINLDLPSNTHYVGDLVTMMLNSDSEVSLVEADIISYGWKSQWHQIYGGFPSDASNVLHGDPQFFEGALLWEIEFLPEIFTGNGTFTLLIEGQFYSGGKQYSFRRDVSVNLLEFHCLEPYSTKPVAVGNIIETPCDDSPGRIYLYCGENGWDETREQNYCNVIETTYPQRTEKSSSWVLFAAIIIVALVALMVVLIFVFNYGQLCCKCCFGRSSKRAPEIPRPRGSLEIQPRPSFTKRSPKLNKDERNVEGGGADGQNQTNGTQDQQAYKKKLINNLANIEHQLSMNPRVNKINRVDMALRPSNIRSHGLETSRSRSPDSLEKRQYQYRSPSKTPPFAQIFRPYAASNHTKRGNQPTWLHPMAVARDTTLTPTSQSAPDVKPVINQGSDGLDSSSKESSAQTFKANPNTRKLLKRRSAPELGQKAKPARQPRNHTMVFGGNNDLHSLVYDPDTPTSQTIGFNTGFDMTLLIE